MVHAVRAIWIDSDLSSQVLRQGFLQVEQSRGDGLGAFLVEAKEKARVPWFKVRGNSTAVVCIAKNNQVNWKRSRGTTCTSVGSTPGAAKREKASCWQGVS